MRPAAAAATLAVMRLPDDRQRIPELELMRELWRMQLLDELHGRLQALEWSPTLDPHGNRRAALRDLIDRYEAIEAEVLRERRTAPRPGAAVRARPRSSR